MPKRLEVYRHKAQYYETDEMGIIHHSNYIRWFEEARVDALDQIGLNYAKMEERGVRIPVLSILCEYRSPVHFNDVVLIIPKIVIFTGVKMIISYRIIDEKSGELRTTGESKHCFLDLNNRPISVKKEHQDIYETLLELVGVDITV